jgi:hypothetical protein
MRYAVLVLVILSACDGETPGGDAGRDGDAGPDDADAGGEVDAGAPFELPITSDGCANFERGAEVSIDATLVPDLAVAVGDHELGVFFVDRAADGSLTARLQRLDSGGTLSGTTEDAIDLGMGLGGAAIASDGARYVMCANGMAGDVVCASAPNGGGAITAGATITGGTFPALAYGAGGFMLAYQTSAGISVQTLDANGQSRGAARALAAGAGRPSIVPTEDGYVLGYATSSAEAQRLDASGAIEGDAIEIGASRSRTPVAVAYIEGVIGATFIEPDGDAAAWTQGNAAALTIGPGAMGFGRVSMAPASNGFVAAWSDFSGYVGYLALTSSGAANGTPAMLGVGWNDNANAIASTGSGFVLFATTGSSIAPITAAPLDCP